MKYDAVILGGGPAAVSAALTLRARGKTAAILSGGIDDIPLSRASRITNYPGCPDISGRALLEAMEHQALDAGAEILHGRATSIAPLGDGFGVIYGAAFCEAETLILRPAAAPATLLAGLAIDGVHVAVDKATKKTSVAGVFAAGDCTGKPYQIAKAVGDGNIAALSAAQYIEERSREKKA